LCRKTSEGQCQGCSTLHNRFNAHKRKMLWIYLLRPTKLILLSKLLFNCVSKYTAR
jgi:hypothetical protein